MLSLVESAFIVSPGDWERIELTSNASGYALDQGGAQEPVNRAARRLWGAPVVVSTSVDAGTGFLFDAASVELRIREDARVVWSENVYDPYRFGTGQAAACSRPTRSSSGARCGRASRCSAPPLSCRST